MRRRRRRTDGGAAARLPSAAGAAALCAAAASPGCNAILGIEAPVREEAATLDGAGSAGTGGALPECALLEVSPEEPLELSMIDDLEDGNVAILDGDGAVRRQGAWYIYNDGSAAGAQDPPDRAGLVVALEPMRGDSTKAVHTSGNDLFNEWGAGVGFPLSTGDYDISAYRGITFWARSDRESPTDMFVTFVDRQTLPGSKLCGEEGQVPCYDHFHAIVTATSGWTHFKVPVVCLRQSGWGRVGALAQDGIRAIQFSFGPGQAFDLWLDDVAFYK